MSVSGIINPADGKIYTELYNGGGGYNLGEVLAVGNQALNPTTGLPQSATDFDNLGCISIETGKVYQGNNLDLEIGEAGDTLKIIGAITKASFLVGNGVNTEEFAVPVAPAPVPPNGSVLILDSTQPLGMRWGGESGPIATITGGNNIDIVGTSANPIVAFQSPTTSDILLGVGTEIQAKDNYATPNYTMSIDATGLNDKYAVGGVVNEEDIAVSSTGVIQTISATDGSTYTNTDITSVSNTGVNEVLTAGNASTQYSTLDTLITGTSTASTTTSIDVGGTYNNTITEGTTTTASYATYQALDTTNTNYGQVNIATNLSSNSASVSVYSSGIPSPPYPAPNASVSIGCADPTNPNISLGQSTPFQPSYSTTIDKNGINQNNSAGAGFNLQTAQDLTLTAPSANKIIVPNGNTIDLSTTGGGGQVFTTEYQKIGYSAQDFVAGNYSGQVQAFTTGGSSQMFISSSNLATASTQYLRLESTFGGDMNIEHNATAGRNLAITTTNNLSITADNIDLSTAGRLIIPSLAGSNYLDYNTTGAGTSGRLLLTQGSVGDITNPALTIQATANNTATYPTIKLDRPSVNSVAGDTIAVQSFNADDYAGATKEYARITTIAQNAGSGGSPTNIDGTLTFQLITNNALNTYLTMNGSTQELDAGKALDLNGNALKSSTNNLPINSNVINLQNTNTTTAPTSHNVVFYANQNGIQGTQYLKLQLNGTDIWIPYLTTDPSI